MSTPPPEGERIAKRMARAGLCSRRDAERWIFEGRVTIDGEVLTTPVIIVTDKMQIRVDGKLLTEAPAPRLWAYHKPDGLLTTHYDPQGRPTIFESLPPSLPRVISIGRLDLNSEGLILLTNDGELSRYAELPSTGWARSYQVRVYGMVDEASLAELSQGITIDGITYGRIEAEVEESADHRRSTNTWLFMTLYEGKNREIRKVLAYLGLRVNRLIRVSYGPFSLGDLKPGQVKEIPHTEVLKAFPTAR
ncbi:MAG: rRNA pseudouridine synthase [Alphaproteobacteria bacterium]|jgi:23S rRNA pseudouridine2605 synthase|nr:rRNA pseudouridine synthase [Alphaproteobacteria bacterium]